MLCVENVYNSNVILETALSNYGGIIFFLYS